MSLLLNVCALTCPSGSLLLKVAVPWKQLHLRQVSTEAKPTHDRWTLIVIVISVAVCFEQPTLRAMTTSSPPCV